MYADWLNDLLDGLGIARVGRRQFLWWIHLTQPRGDGAGTHRPGRRTGCYKRYYNMRQVQKRHFYFQTARA
jgi:hypothetical protein